MADSEDWTSTEGKGEQRCKALRTGAGAALLINKYWTWSCGVIQDVELGLDLGLRHEP